MKKILIFNALLLLVSAVSAQKISFPVEELRVDTLRSRTGTAVVSVHPLEVADGLTVYSAGAPRLFLVEAVDSSGFRRFGVTMNGALIAGTNHDTEVNIDGLAMVGRYNALKGADAFAVGKGIINNADTAMALGYHYTIPENKRNVTVIGYGSNRIEMSADSGRFIGNWHKYAQVNSDWNASGGISQILNKPTTITGYGITDAYTQTQTRTLVGDTASVLRELIKSGVPESDPVWTAEKADYYTRTDMQTSGQSQVHWNNITNKPSVGAGSVTSVGLSMPDIFSISGSPVTGSGTLTASLAGQTQASVFAAPATANGVPTFRSLAETDIPNLNWTKITSRPTTLSGYGITDAYTQTQTRTLVGDTATVLRELIKSPIPGNNNTVLVLQDGKAKSFADATLINNGTASSFKLGYGNNNRLISTNIGLGVYAFKNNSTDTDLYPAGSNLYPYSAVILNPGSPDYTPSASLTYRDNSLLTDVSANNSGFVVHRRGLRDDTTVGNTFLRQNVNGFYFQQKYQGDASDISNMSIGSKQVSIRRKLNILDDDFEYIQSTIESTSDNDLSFTSPKAGTITLSQIMKRLSGDPATYTFETLDVSNGYGIYYVETNTANASFPMANLNAQMENNREITVYWVNTYTAGSSNPSICLLRFPSAALGELTFGYSMVTGSVGNWTMNPGAYYIKVYKNGSGEMTVMILPKPQWS
jgi:hypothetical protein